MSYLFFSSGPGAQQLGAFTGTAEGFPQGTVFVYQNNYITFRVPGRNKGEWPHMPLNNRDFPFCQGYDLFRFMERIPRVPKTVPSGMAGSMPVVQKQVM